MKIGFDKDDETGVSVTLQPETEAEQFQLDALKMAARVLGVMHTHERSSITIYVK